jgi:putative peptidoglycan binding protein
VPRQIAKDETPRRRRSAKAVAIEADAERGLLMRALLYSPKDMVAGVLAFAAVSAIVTNALFLQAGRHPSPMFGSVVALPAATPASGSPMPRPRPVEIVTRPAEPPPSEPKPIDPKATDSVASLARSGNAPTAGSSRPSAVAAASHTENSAAAAARRVAAVQRALTEYGYGQLKPTGTAGSDTQAAIQKFEREHKIPVTGQVSDRLVRELTAVTGRPIE